MDTKKIKGTKLNLVVNSQNIILSSTIMSGNRNDTRGFLPTIRKIRIKTKRVGRPNQYPKNFYLDKGYDTKFIRNWLKNRDTSVNIPKNKRNRKSPKKGRPFKLDEDYFSIRGGVERSFAWLKSRFRKLAIRYEFSAYNFFGFIGLATFLSNWEILR
jgi:transposase